MPSVTIAQPVHERFGRHSDRSVQYSHMLSRLSLMRRPEAVPPWAASTGQCSGSHCCSACGARARLGQHHAGERGTGPAGHQAAWQAAGMPFPISTDAEHLQMALSMPALVSSVGEQECAAGTPQSSAALSEVLTVTTYECVRSACSCRQLANIWIAQKLLHRRKWFLTLNLPLCVHAESMVKTFLSL